MNKSLVLSIVALLSLTALGVGVIGQTGAPAAQSLTPEDTGPVGRYQMLHIQEQSELTLWMIDTCTGRIWRRFAQNDGDHWTQTIREDYPLAAVRLQGMPPKPPVK